VRSAGSPETGQGGGSSHLASGRFAARCGAAARQDDPAGRKGTLPLDLKRLKQLEALLTAKRSGPKAAQVRRRRTNASAFSSGTIMAKRLDLVWAAIVWPRSQGCRLCCRLWPGSAAHLSPTRICRAVRRVPRSGPAGDGLIAPSTAGETMESHRASDIFPFDDAAAPAPSDIPVSAMNRPDQS
jgi:hypothetical protein